jgi:transposase
MLRAYLLQTHEMLFDAHNTPSGCFGGVPQRGHLRQYAHGGRQGRHGARQRQVNARFSAMVSHYMFEAEFCNPAAGWEKGQIEKNVQDARHRLWQPMPNFPSLAALNDWLESDAGSSGQDIPHGTQPGSIAEAWAEEGPR